MKSDNATMLRTCPEHPAMSRNYPNTAICPDCGTREALQSIGVNTAEQDKILSIIHRNIGR